MTTSSQLLTKTRKKAKQQLWREMAKRMRNEIAMGVIFKLTDSGKALASKIVRAHRLWETYLEKHLDQFDIDSPAHRLEHATTTEMSEQLSRELSAPEKDPHGSRIPPK